MAKAIAKILNVISITIIICAVAILLVVVTTKKGEAPNIFGYSMFRVVTGSMEPTIETDSMIVVKRVPASELKVDDIITFYSTDPSLNGAVNTHRVKGIEKVDGKLVFTTRGDANNADDIYPAKEEYIIGRVVGQSHGFGLFVRLLSNPLVFVVVIIIPFILLIVTNLVKTVQLTGDIMREEEEAAVREAVEKALESKKAREKKTEPVDGAESEEADNKG